MIINHIYMTKLTSSLMLCFRQRADLAITDLTITSDRVSAIDFTPSFMNLGKWNSQLECDGISNR